MAILVVGPSSGLDRPLDSFGKVARVDITIPEPKGSEAPAATSESMAKGREILARAVDALGGGPAVDAVRSVRTTSDTTVRTPQGEMTVKVISTVALPDKARQELETPMGTMLRIVSGDQGFMVTPMGAMPMPGTQREEMARSTRRQPLMLAQHRADPGLKVQAVGQETVDDRPADVILVTYGDDEVRLYVDRETGRILRQAYRGQGPAGPGEFTVSYSDFRQVSGLTIPFRTSASLDGEPLQTSVSQEVVINPEIDAALFEKPDTGPSAADGGGK